MSRATDIKSAKKALLLICEGNNTEPIFFSNFQSEEDGFVFEISPKPKLVPQDMLTCANRGSRKRSKRQLLGNNDSDDIPVCGVPPLSWVNAAEKQFDTFEEIWCVFDKDEHPYCKAAFEKVEAIKRDGHNLNIAFSSISIEYYFLLHFEYVYKKFLKSECKVSKKKRANCMLSTAIPGYACNGDKCVNGYARMKGYWTESKSNENDIYPVLKDKLFVGIKNAELLRRESESQEGDKPIYCRNPYTTVDYLIARLLGYSILSEDQLIKTKVDSTYLSITKHGNVLRFSNIGSSSCRLTNTFVTLIDGKSAMDFKKTMIQPLESCHISLSGHDRGVYFINSTANKILFVQ